MNDLVINVSHILTNLGEEIEVKGEKDFSPILTTFRELKFTRPVMFEIKARNVGNGLLVDGTFVAKIGLPCSRCLDHFSYTSQTSFEELFHLDGDNNFKVVNGMINVGPLAEQTIVMNMPVKTLCREDCRGLCPHCGANLNQEKGEHKHDQIPSRFSQLKDLLKGK